MAARYRQWAAYEGLVTPDSKRVIRQALSRRAHVDFHRPHAPLLAGSTDQIMPAKLNRANFQRYTHAASVIQYHELPGRSHAMQGQPTWREDAAYVLRWLTEV